MKFICARLALGLGLFSSAAYAAPIPVQGVSSSSHYTEEGNYEAARVIDGKQGTAWVEGDAGSGLGAWVTLDLGSEQAVKSLRIWGGDWYDHTSWSRANRPRDIELKFSDGSTHVISMTDAFEAQSFELPEVKRTSTVRFRLKSVYNGTAWPDTGISEIQLFSDTKSAMDSATVSVSSTATADGDGNYAAANAHDFVIDSMWCEGDDGDGTGQWIQYNFASPTALSSVSMINGIGGSLMLWMKANRATTAQLTFSEGATHDITLANSKKPQTISFPEKTTESVRVTFTGVSKGKEYNDLCVSEIAFQ